MDLAELNALSREAFVARLGDVYEHAPWVAEAAVAERPFASRSHLQAAMRAAVGRAPGDDRLELIRGHPELAGRAARADDLTGRSQAEQAGAGLDGIDSEQSERLTKLNAAYRERFGFPYVVCVREHDVEGILADASARLDHDAETETATALAEIDKIAAVRLADLVAAAPQISYGKVDVPVHVVSEQGLLACEVSLEVLGDAFLGSYTHGDNTRVVATDTMKNVILRHALEQDTSTLDSFADGLGRHFLSTYADMEGVRVRVVELPFEAVTDKLFRRIDADHAEVDVELRRDAAGGAVRVGAQTAIVGLRLLKTTGSAFTRFARDDATTLPERVDRPLYIHLDVHVDHVAPVAPGQLRGLLLDVFDAFVSESIQQLVFEMGHRVLREVAPVTRIAFVAQNHTHDPVPGSPPSPQLPRAYTSPFPAWGNITLTLER